MPALRDPSMADEIQAALDEVVLSWSDITPSKMFGSNCYRAKGVLFAMIGGKGVITTKLSSEQRLAAETKSGANAFVGAGKVVPSWTEFPVSSADDVVAIQAILRHSYDNAVAEA